jgi:hypothetical protein
VADETAAPAASGRLEPANDQRTAPEARKVTLIVPLVWVV